MKFNKDQLEKAATKLWEIGSHHGWWPTTGQLPIGYFWCATCCVSLQPGTSENSHKNEGHMLKYIKPLSKHTWQEVYKNDPIRREEFLDVVALIVGAYLEG